jgi:hypothetical protein
LGSLSLDRVLVSVEESGHEDGGKIISGGFRLDFGWRSGSLLRFWWVL